MEEIVTGEAVVLDLPYARFPTRLLARLLDMLIQVVVLFILLIVIGVANSSNALNGEAEGAVVLAALVLVIVGYPVTFETLSRGRTLGKMALGLRVVTDDGGPIRFRHALVRALAGVVECWLLIGIPALITAMLSVRGKRLGDIFAGTFAVRERVPQAGIPLPVAPGFGPYPMAFIHPNLRPWAASLDLSAVPDQLAAAATSYLSRYGQLNEATRGQLGRRLATDVAAQVSPPPPPGLSPADFLHTVIAERRNRELARLMPPAPPATPWATPPATQWATPHNTQWATPHDTQWAAPPQAKALQDNAPQDTPPEDILFTPPS